MLEGKEPEQEKPEAETPEPEADEAEPESEEAKGDGEAVKDAKPQEDEKPKKPREQKSVPLAAFLEVQNKLKAELEEKSKKLSEFEAKAKAAPDYSAFYKKPPETVPSIYEDEQGYAAATRQQMQAESFNNRLGMSLSYAVQSFGQDKVNAAMGAFQEAAKANPMLHQAAEASYNPVLEIIQWHETQTKLAFADKLKAEELQQLAAAGGLDGYTKALRAQIEAELKAAKAEPNADDDEADEAPPAKLNLPSNFNKGGKGGSRPVPASSSLKDLLA